MPTWFITRALYDAVGGFEERPPGSGEAEDMVFFQTHLSLHAADNQQHGHRSLVRVGDANTPLLLYRWSAGSGTSRVPRRRLIEVRAAHFERRVLNGSWRTHASFLVWGAGRDGKHFVLALSAEAQARIRAFIDVDPKKIGTVYPLGQRRIPIVGFDSIANDARNKDPVVVCVSLRRGNDVLRGNVEKLGRTEGADLWFFN